MPRLHSKADALRYLGKRDVRNFAGRKGYGVDFVVLHYTWGAKWSDLDTLISNRASSHLYITVNGDIYWLVSFENAAWHAGINPVLAPKRAARIRPNERSVGIEIEGKGDFTEEQYRALEVALPPILKRFSIPLALPPDPLLGCDPRHPDPYPIEFFDGFRGLLAHGNIHKSKVDPGINFDWDRVRCLELLPDPGCLSLAENYFYRSDHTQLPEGGIGYEPRLA